MPTERKVAVITGASQGIGASLVKGFHEIGYGVVANSRAISKSQDFKSQDFKSHDPSDRDIIAVDGDIASPQTAERIVDAAIARFGRIDTLVNNAGIFIAKPFLDYSEADFAAMTAVNIGGFFHMSQKAIAAMMRAGFGHVINITATIAEQPMASLATALATLTKGGLNAATRALAVEYARSNIRVNAVSPGVIRTPMHPPATHEFLAGLAPMNRMGEPKDIVEAVLFLERAAFVTGEILHVDGGASAGRW